MRTKLGALLGAGGLLLMAASATITFAAPPSFSISVSKTASPASVPSTGGTVAFTVWVTNDGPDFLQTVNITEPLVGCTLGAKVETSGDGDGKLETGETWSYSCSVPNVLPGTTNNVTVNACKDMSACNNSAHDTQDTASVTVQDDGSTAPPATAVPTVDPGTPVPTVDPGTPVPTVDPGTPGPNDTPVPTLDTAGQTEFPTDTIGEVVAGVGSQRSLLLVISLGMLLASLILITPTRPVRARNTER
jgi:uncharacterized repeat protein (TIGR01451 family)